MPTSNFKRYGALLSKVIHCLIIDAAHNICAESDGRSRVEPGDGQRGRSTISRSQRLYLWYGKGDGPEKAINLIVVEAKATEPHGRCETGDEQALGYMGKCLRNRIPF